MCVLPACAVNHSTRKNGQHSRRGTNRSPSGARYLTASNKGKEGNAMASLQLDEFQEFESRALPYYASWEVIERILRAGALVCVVLLLSGLGLARKVVTARATIPFTFWAQGHEFQAGDYVFDSEVPGSATIHFEGTNSAIGVSSSSMPFR